MHETSHDQQVPVPEEQVGLRGWSLYFLFKFLLYTQGVLQLKPLENLALMAFVAYPLKHSWARWLRFALALLAAVWLIHAESFLPSWSQLFSSLKLMLDFDLEYLLELAGRLVSGELLAILVLALFGYLLLSRFVRMGVIVSVLFVILWLMQWKQPLVAHESPVAQTSENEPALAANQQQPVTLDDKLQAFYREQAGKKVDLSLSAGKSPPFDVLFVHICSLSWDDLAYVHQQGSLPAFDVLFKNFNSATSYSGPAAIRVLRASCGQPSHEALYKPAPEGCYLFDALHKLGYEKQLLMNHDGHFDGFAEILARNGMDAPAFPLKNVPADLRAFDGSPIHNDRAVLSAWWQQRIQTANTRVAAYYNTLTLHDGNRYTSGNNGQNSLQSYSRRLNDLMSGLDSFFRQLEQSGRRVLVVMVPEHGAALRGSAIQLQGMREIPTPDITRVPVGIRLFGPGLHRPDRAVVVDEPVSYLALSEYLAALLSYNPYAAGAYEPQKMVSNLSQIRFVSETASAKVMQDDQQFWLKLDGEDGWMPLNIDKNKTE